MNALAPLQSNKTVHHLSVPAAYRSWAHWCNSQGFGGMQVSAIKASGVEGDARHAALSEVYARAIMETALGHHFDHVDMRADVLVALQIKQVFGGNIALLVHSTVAASGPVIRPWEEVSALSEEAEGSPP